MTEKTNKAFTLIELLIVIAIVGLLASIVLGALSSARAKGRDALRKQDMAQMRTALALYYNNTGTMPANQTPCCGYPDSSPNFLNELISSGILAKAPHSPSGANSFPYYYYDYGQGNTIGAIVVTALEAEAPSIQYPGTCRPWAPSVNWCDQQVGSWYCLCYPY